MAFHHVGRCSNGRDMGIVDDISDFADGFHPVHMFPKINIHDDEVEFPAGGQVECFRTVFGKNEFVFILENIADKFLMNNLIFYHKNPWQIIYRIQRRMFFRFFNPCEFVARGNRMMNSDPLPGVLFTDISPPMS